MQEMQFPRTKFQKFPWTYPIQMCLKEPGYEVANVPGAQNLSWPPKLKRSQHATGPNPNPNPKPNYPSCKRRNRRDDTHRRSIAFVSPPAFFGQGGE